MRKNPFTNYLLKLGTDASEVARFRTGGDGARQSMGAAGLTDRRLQDVLLSGNQDAIDAAVAAEIVVADMPPGATAIPVRIVSHVQFLTSPPDDE
jgi:hypothetical protein